jgi:MFS family permease
VGAVGSALGAIGIAASFATGGAPMWLVAAAGSIVGGAAVPALGVYGAELFPTGNRGRASGFISVISLVGSSAGLLAAGWLLDRTVGYGAVMAGLAIGPLIVSVLVVALYPETAHAELEDLNPEDRRPAPAAASAESAAPSPDHAAPEREAPAG